MTNVEPTTGLELVDRVLSDTAIRSLVGDVCRNSSPVILSTVKCDSSNAFALLAVVGFKPMRIQDNKECLSLMICDLQQTQSTARLVMNTTVYKSVLSSITYPQVEGLMLLILHPKVSVDSVNGSLVLTITMQNQLAVVGKCKYFGRCGAEKRSIGLNSDNNLCKIPVDYSRFQHCCYHDRPSTNHIQTKEIIGIKRPLDLFLTTESNKKPDSTSSNVLKTHTKERELEENEPDRDDIAFNLRHHTSTVESILGAAYNITNNNNNQHSSGSGSGSSAHILRQADEIELKVAEKIIQTLAQQENNSNNKTPRGIVASSSSNNNSNSGSISRITEGQIPNRPKSAFMQRMERQQLARSGNQSAIQTASGVQNGSFSIPSTTRSNLSGGTQTGAYKLVGDTIINTANLYKNTATMTGNTNTGVLNHTTSSGVATFQQLLGGSSKTTSSSVSNKRSSLPSNTTTTTSATRRPVTAPTNTTTSTTSSTGSTTNTSNSKTAQAARLNAEIDSLLGRTSSHASEASADWAEGFGKRMDVLAKREYAQTKAAEIHSIDITAYKCVQCDNHITEQFPALCQDKKHNIHKISVVKRFFECGQCNKREYSLSARRDLGNKVVLPPEVRCSSCGAYRWRACGQRGSGPLSTTARELSSGSSGGAGSVGGGQAGKLILTASEWTRKGDSVTMAERVSRL